MSDLIDRQAAIDALLRLVNCKTVRELFEYNAAHNLAEMWSGGINDAIDAIIAVPPALSTNLAEVGTDCVSRQAAIKILHEALDAADQIADVPFGVYQNYRDKMNELPPAQPEPSQVVTDIARIVENEQDMRVIAQPERIKGHWVDDCTYMGIQCSACGKSLQDYIHATEYAELMEVPNYCPNCGSDNRGVTE